MPIYSFSCKKCEQYYEELTAYDKTGKYKSVKCPECGSKSKIKLVDNCSWAFGNPVGSDRWNSESQGHDYRFRHNLPKVIDQRKKAEEISHVGKTPYRSIDDVNSGKHFGEVK